jgi:hypothetical protein
VVHSAMRTSADCSSGRAAHDSAGHLNKPFQRRPQHAVGDASSAAASPLTQAGLKPVGRIRYHAMLSFNAVHTFAQPAGPVPGAVSPEAVSNMRPLLQLQDAVAAQTPGGRSAIC